VIQTLMSLRAELDLSYIFVTHDLSLVRLISDNILVMQRGRLVESGSADQVFRNPREKYTQELIAAVPVLGERRL
jgi:peptide/nickel transport system ATP-binding protein